MTGGTAFKPLIVIIGATGTGKSQLAVEIATRFDGEIINGDAMQMYDGLPIITNKINPQEQKGIPHHLLGVVGVAEEPWRVGIFKRKAGEVINEIHSRGKLPILVGGTHYYTQSLLFKDVLVSGHSKNGDASEHNMSRQEISRRYPILERPTEEILQQLRQIDPIMADRWHPNDRRRIQRSLEIYLTSGRLASEVYEEQRERRKLHGDHETELEFKSDPSFDHEDAPLVQPTLIFWVHADSEILRARLDSRVDKMIEGGLLNEVTALDIFLQDQSAAGSGIDQSCGIWASIGFKEFEPYLAAMESNMVSSKDVEMVLSAAIEKVKAATRQYARRQIRWIRLKFLAALSNANALRSIYILDGSDLDKWPQHVTKPALDIVHKFIAQEELPPPMDISPTVCELLVPKQTVEFCDRRDLWIRQTCELCNMTAVTEEQWQHHLKGRGHRRAVKKANKNTSPGRLRAQDKKLTADTESP